MSLVSSACWKAVSAAPTAQRTIVARYAAGEVSLADLADEYSVSRTTVHRVLHRKRPTPTT